MLCENYFSRKKSWKRNWTLKQKWNVLAIVSKGISEDKTFPLERSDSNILRNKIRKILTKWNKKISSCTTRLEQKDVNCWWCQPQIFLCLDGRINDFFRVLLLVRDWTEIFVSGLLRYYPNSGFIKEKNEWRRYIQGQKIWRKIFLSIMNAVKVDLLWCEYDSVKFESFNACCQIYQV